MAYRGRKREQRPRSVHARDLKGLVNREKPAPVVRRPLTRGDCAAASRPCPFVGCRYNLYLDVRPLTGSLTFNFPDLELEELEETCALDVADGTDQTLEQVGALLNLTRERARQIQVAASKKLRANRDVDELASHFITKGAKRDV